MTLLQEQTLQWDQTTLSKTEQMLYALYMADAANFPDGTAATDVGLVDAVVYGTSDADDTGLLAALRSNHTVG